MDITELDENTLIGDVLKAAPGTAQIFMEFGMQCLHCGSARHESIRDAGEMHGVNVDELVDQLICYFAELEQQTY